MRPLPVVVAAWMLSCPVRAQVNLPEGFEIVEFSVDQTRTNRPTINNCGQIFYNKDRFDRSRLYLYDNGKITRLTDYDEGRLVSAGDINDDGTIVWARGYFNQPDTFRIIMLEDGIQHIIGTGWGDANINSAGHLSWELFRQNTCNMEQDIIYYDGRSAIPITDDHFTNQSSRINDSDWIVWGRSDHCVEPWLGWIPLYIRGQTVILPSLAPQNHVPTINNVGQIAWLGGGIQIWENGTTYKLTDWAENPYLNDLGDIYTYRWHDENNSTDAWLYRVSAGEPTWHRLTDDGLLDSPGDINDWTEAVWRFIEDPYNQEWPGGVRFLRRVRTGDSEFDGDIDAADYFAFADCMTGPGRVDRLCDCRFLDIDHDGDVDLGDFARFQNGFTER